MANESFSEKVSVNINTSTLSGIDLLVDHGYYSNRSDFINQRCFERATRNKPNHVRGFERDVLAEVSQNLGHNRISVVYYSYLNIA